MAGFNVSYENSFSAIKRDIMKETLDKKKPIIGMPMIEPIQERPPGSSSVRSKQG
jgi:hypothetical protein